MREVRELLKDAVKAVYLFLTNRILWLFILLALMFYLLFARLYELQIVMTDQYKAAPPKTKEVTVPVQALRGSVYDSSGRPLAINKLAYVIKMDPSVSITNEALYELVKVFERNGEDYVDNMPMTPTEPYAFTYPEGDWQDWYEFRWKDDMTVANPETATAPETFVYLREQFKIDPLLSNAEARKVLNFRCMIYMERMIDMEAYEPEPITLAYDVSPETVAAVEEGNGLFTGVYVDVQALREYPQGEYFSHMLGYIRQISESELESNKDNGYTSQDLIGKAGLERSMEKYLRGTSGSQTIEVNASGRRNPGSSAVVTEAIPGDRIFLTVDASLQQRAYHLLEDMLSRALIAKITSKDTREAPITLKQLFTSLIKSNNLDIKSVMEAPEGSDAYTLRKYILDRFPDANASLKDDREKIKGLLTDGIEAGRVTPVMLLVTMIDIGQLSDPEGLLVLRLKSGNLTAQQAVIEKIEARELTPQMLNLDPCSGSIVVVDVHNGDVLAAIGYPSYDNNRLVNNFDNEYYRQINEYDPTLPLLNRPFMEPRAPGSTLKMITAAAALESGVITTTSTIYDEHSFTKVGKPYTNCWSGSSHGYVNVSQALQVSCNYFFCEVAYRMGNKSGAKNAGISALNDYMIYFGLNDKTGVEIGELYNAYDDVEELFLRISSPEFKEYTEKSRDKFAQRSQWDWYDGDTVRTAMGQSLNNYTPAMMARYISVIANRGLRYPLHLVNRIEDYNAETVMRYTAVPDGQDLTISDKTWDAIIEGMRLVTEGTGTRTGTGVGDFKDFPIRVAGKTGTAQQVTSRNDHSSFAGFAPYDDPQIAVYVSVPFGDTRAFTHIAARIAREMIGETLGLGVEPEPPAAVNALQP